MDLNATEPGLHTVEVEWDNAPIPGSPFLVRIMQAPDVKKVRAFGPGLESGLIGKYIFWSIFCKAACMLLVMYPLLTLIHERCERPSCLFRVIVLSKMIFSITIYLLENEIIL